MAVGADTVARALTDGWERMLNALPDGWAHRGPGGLAGSTAVPLAMLNGVWADQVDLTVDVATALLDRVAATALPHCLQLRPGCEPALSELAVERGMRAEPDVPLMLLDGRGTFDPGPPGLVIRELAPDQGGEHAAVAAAGFGAPEEDFRPLVTPPLLGRAGVRSYIGEVDGEPVTTGIGVTFGDAVAIFNIATPPAHRRRGYGGAVTARAVQDGFAGGAHWAWLQASDAGRPVYERLGFRTIESWSCWSI